MYVKESLLDTLTNTNFSKADIVKLAHHEAIKMYEFRVTCNFEVNEQEGKERLRQPCLTDSKSLTVLFSERGWKEKASQCSH